MTGNPAEGAGYSLNYSMEIYHLVYTCTLNVHLQLLINNWHKYTLFIYSTLYKVVQGHLVRLEQKLLKM